MRKFMISFALLVYAGLAAYSLFRLEAAQNGSGRWQTLTAETARPITLLSANPARLSEFYNLAFQSDCFLEADGDSYRGNLLGETLLLQPVNARNVRRPQRLRFIVADVAQLQAALAGVGVKTQTIKSVSGERMLIVRDPEGNVIEISGTPRLTP